LVWVALLALARGAVGAGTLSLPGGGTLGIELVATAPILKTTAGAAVKGELTVAPSKPLDDGSTAAFCLDGQVKLLSSIPRPELNLDTTKLKDGLHELRIDVLDGQRLAYSTGAVPIHVLNDASQGLFEQRRPAEIPFNKVYRKLMFLEIVWFNGREADLEKHGFIQRGRVYITLTDLIRHIGGNIIWGPSRNYVVVERGGTMVQVFPGSARVLVDGKPQSLGRPATRIDDRTFVPVRPMCDIFGLLTHWNKLERRANVALNR